MKDRIIDIIASIMAFIVTVVYALCLLPFFIAGMIRAYSKYIYRLYFTVLHSIEEYRQIEALINGYEEDAL